MSKTSSGDGPRVRLAQGAERTVWAIEVAGTNEVVKLLGSLRLREKAKFEKRFALLAQMGKLRTPDQYRVLNSPGRPKVIEIKIDNGPGYRIYGIRVGRQVYLTHGSKKPKDQQVANEIKKARALFSDWCG